ncbi:O-antigen ligase family protein [Psychroflexus salis]|uniref:Ligase n=1 Tax=Psychroflexus salis TaxID=1526574 RepID=A0A916ZRH6_9FLAO|nr:O-antigen ligase family protein [Psychroflexus salis]GGE10507.1 ligase [Psychroflexus salis]
MLKKNLKQKLKKPTRVMYLNFVIFHVLIGILIYSFKFLSLIYLLGILAYYIFKIIKNQKDKFVPIEAAAYIMAVEVFLRMTNGMVFYESGKYAVILFFLLGMYFHSFKLKGLPILIYFLALIPSIYFTYQSIHLEDSFRKFVLFNLSGPFSLVVTTLYCYDLKISLKRFLGILNIIVLPVITMTTYLFLYTPDLKAVIIGSQSNFAASGGFGPNQVSTTLGIGIFILLIRLIVPYRNQLVQLIMMLILAAISYRALATLSRGGVVVAILMFVVFLVLYAFYAPAKSKLKLVPKLGLLVLGAILVWSYTLVQTNNQLANRYTNKNARGIQKEDASAGRFDLIETEFNNFSENPIFGVGVGIGKYARLENEEAAASHNELTRMLSEHGSFGLVGILVLLLIPAFRFLKNPQNLFMISLLIFWGATINHSAMRIAAPGFMYGFAMLNIQYRKKKKKVGVAASNKSFKNENLTLSRQ